MPHMLKKESAVAWWLCMLVVRLSPVMMLRLSKRQLQRYKNWLGNRLTILSAHRQPHYKRPLVEQSSCRLNHHSSHHRPIHHRQQHHKRHQHQSHLSHQYHNRPRYHLSQRHHQHRRQPQHQSHSLSPYLKRDQSHRQATRNSKSKGFTCR